MLDKNERDGVLTKSQPSPTDNMVIVVWFSTAQKFSIKIVGATIGRPQHRLPPAA